ncbi:MAG: GNAT family N-acetyltransferase [Sphingobium sp.]
MPSSFRSRRRGKLTEPQPEITIALEDGERHGRYVGKVAGIDAEAEIRFTHCGPGLISADHTGAPEALKGTGVAAALVDYLIADARQRGFRIIPICPYVRARYGKHPDWQDVMTVAPGETPQPPA